MPEGRSSRRAEEQDLLQRARRLEESALSAIFDAYYQPLYRYVCRHIGAGPAAEDLTAEVFRNFLEQLRIRRGPTTFLRAWLYRVAHNLIVDELRRTRTRELEVLDETRHAHDPEVGELVQHSITQQTVLSALGRLTDKQRTVLVLKYLEGLETDEIAQSLNMSIVTVKALQHRGMQALRRNLQQSGILDETDP